MSEIEKKIDEAALDHRLNGGDSAYSFLKGAYFGISLEKERSKKLVEALEWYASQKETVSAWLGGKIEILNCDKAKQALSEYEGEK